MIIKKTCIASIYEIVNTITGSRYVGSTRRSPYNRWAQHVRQLKMQFHVNSRLQAAWNQSQIDHWSFRIVEHVPEELQRKREQFWILELKPDLNIDQKPKLKNDEKIEQALCCRQQGLTYRRIAEQVNMSLGWVANTLKQYELSSNVH